MLDRVLHETCRLGENLKYSYPSTQDLIDGSRLFKRTFGLHHGTHLFHVKHKSVQGLLDVILFLFG